MIVFAIAGLLMATEPAAASAANAAAPAPQPVSGSSNLLALPAGDEDIRRALFEMHAADPERKVCTTQVVTGSRRTKTTCGTLREWFAAREPADVQARRAPWQLMNEIKEQRRKANVRRAG